MFGAALATAAFLTQTACWSLLRTGFYRARRRSPSPAQRPVPPLSVIIAARNEAKTLPALLDALTQQTHPRFEIVVVDDASTDATADVVRAYAEHDARVRLVSVEHPQAPCKKHALTQGIGAAAYGLLAFTDADCQPSPSWLETLARHHAATPGEMLLIGYSPYRKRPDWVGRLAAYETFVTGFLTAAAVGLNRPYMAVGRNLSYSKRVFDRVDGFAHSARSLSGDDDLLVQEVARRGAAHVCHVFDPRSFVPTDAPPTWRAWLRQKRRHASAGRFYARTVQGPLALFQATNVVLWTAPLWAGWLGWGLLGGKLLLQGWMLRHAAHTLQEQALLPSLPVLELLYAGYNLFIAPLGLAKIPEKW